MFLSTKFEQSVWPRLVAPLLAGLLASAAYSNQSQAEPGASAPPAYVISDREGYGVVECLTQKRDCGKVVADSWCEAHGHGPARAFGPADDVTASIGPAAASGPVEAGAAVVACQE